MAAGGEGSHAQVGDAATGAELDPVKGRPAAGDEVEGVIADAIGQAVAAQGETRDGIESREKRRKDFDEGRLGIQGKAAAVVGLNLEPAATDEGTEFAVVGSQEVEYDRQAVFGQVQCAVARWISGHFCGGDDGEEGR